MTNENSCNIIRDLLPLYIDRIESDESREAIKEHMKFCPDCRKYYKSIRRALSITTVDQLTAEPNDYIKISRKIRKRRALYAGSGALLLMGTLAYTIYSMISQPKAINKSKQES